MCLLFHRDVLQKLKAISLLKSNPFTFYSIRFLSQGKVVFFNEILCKFGNIVFSLQNAFNIQKSSSRRKGISKIMQVFHRMTPPPLANGGPGNKTSLGAKLQKFKGGGNYISLHTDSIHFSAYTSYCFLIVVGAVFQNSHFFDIIT